MSETGERTVTGIFRYPVKGLAGQPLGEVALTAGETIPFDRAWAIENGLGRFDPDHPKPLPKINFLMLMRNERLATLEIAFDPATEHLTLLRQGKQVARGDLRTRIGRQLIEQFIGAYMKDALRGPPRIVAAPGHSFSDVPAKWLHVVNLASVRELERRIGRPLDARRFRANLLIDGFAPREELQWVGARLSVGAATLEVVHLTERCEATNVEPGTGARDMAIPAELMRGWGHMDFGVYAKVTAGGIVKIADPVTVN